MSLMQQHEIYTAITCVAVHFNEPFQQRIAPLHITRKVKPMDYKKKTTGLWIKTELICLDGFDSKVGQLLETNALHCFLVQKRYLIQTQNDSCQNVSSSLNEKWLAEIRVQNSLS